MNGLPPLVRDQRKVDTDHLRLLSIFHFIGCGLGLLGILFLLGHYALFSTIFSNPKMWENQRQAPPPPQLFAMLKWMYLVLGCWVLSSVILNLVSGLFILRRRHRVFSLVVAAINCLHLPLGTVLGVFTIVVLMRQSVLELYEYSPPFGGEGS
jgi:hypothetical protein